MFAALRPAVSRAFPKLPFAAFPRRAISTRFTSDHEWATYDKPTNIATVGITDYAQKALGDVVFVELPIIGDTIGQGGKPNFSLFGFLILELMDWW